MVDVVVVDDVVDVADVVDVDVADVVVVVVDDVADVVVVVAVVEDGAVVDVVVVVGVVVGVVVVVDVPAADAFTRAVTIVPLGLGSFVPAGTNPTVISWLSVNPSVAGLPLTVEGCCFAAKAFGQYVTTTCALLPAYFVPEAHFWPLW